MKAAAAQRPLAIRFETLGCRLNQFESDGLLDRFFPAGATAWQEMTKNPI